MTRHHVEAETPITLPVEVAAILWADAYHATLRPALHTQRPVRQLAALDHAIDQIEQRLFASPPTVALSV